jgi:hypothetical protein
MSDGLHAARYGRNAPARSRRFYPGAVTGDATFDTSFWVNAFRAGLLPFVRERFTLHYAPTVADELPDTNPPGREFRRLVQSGELGEVRPLAATLREFGPGERAAMSVALEHPEWTLLLDDYRPYRASVERGIHVACSPLLAVTLYEERAITEAQLDAILDRLEAIRTVSPLLLREARQQWRP